MTRKTQPMLVKDGKSVEGYDGPFWGVSDEGYVSIFGCFGPPAPQEIAEQWAKTMTRKYERPHFPVHVLVKKIDAEL